MYRRVELIQHRGDPIGKDRHGRVIHRKDDYKSGLMCASTEEVVDAWIAKLRGPYRSIPTNAKFYFTEKGWKEVGREVVAACQRSGQDYRVIAIKETDAQVVWRDKFTGYEVAIQPKRRRA